MDITKNEFVSLLHHHQGIINSLCGIYFSNLEDREDARQDIILQLWKAIPNFKEQAQLSTWIYRVSLNTILAKRRNEKKRLPTEVLDANQKMIDLQFYPSDDDLQMLHQIIAQLNDQDKALVVLYLEGYRNLEIAEILGQTRSNISTRLNRIKTKLKSLVKSIDYDVR